MGNSAVCHVKLFSVDEWPSVGGRRAGPSADIEILHLQGAASPALDAAITHLGRLTECCFSRTLGPS